MGTLSLEKVYELLGTTEIPGDEREIRALCARMSELAKLNGTQWIRKNRMALLEQWRSAVKPKTVR